MRIAIVTHARRGSRIGNRVTAERWRKLLTKLGHRVTVTSALPRARWDVLVALHARHTARAIAEARRRHPERPIVLALTGTDLYRDIHRDADARRSLELADRLVVLHDLAPRALPRAMRHKVRVIRQSAPAMKRRAARRGVFEVAFVAHVRPEKDPLRVAEAVRLLPESSRIRVTHVGRALSPEMRRAALRESRTNERYRWLGEASPAESRALIARSKLLVLTSLMEGGANVLGEAIMAGIPIVASRIPASEAALGRRYPGLFGVKKTRDLVHLLLRAEGDRRFLGTLRRATRARRWLFGEDSELRAWKDLLRGEIVRIRTISQQRESAPSSEKAMISRR